MRTFRSRWSNGLLWVVEIRKLLASHSSCENMTLRLRTSFIISAWNSLPNCKPTSRSLSPPGLLKCAKMAAALHLFRACPGKCAVTAKSRCYISGRSSLPSRGASLPLPIIPSAGWRWQSSDSVARGQTGSNLFAGNLSAAPASFRTRSSATVSPIFLLNSSRTKRSNRL